MTYTFGPQDGVSESQAFWTLMGQVLLSTGVVSGKLNAGAVTSVSGLQVQADTVQAWIKGFFFQSDAAVAITLSTADPSNPRIDRIVIHIDMSAHTADIRKLTGTPAGSPSAPSLTQTSTVWEISLAKIAVAAAASSVSGANITDERTYATSTFLSGSGSGLDADTLDTHDSSYFLASSTYTAADILTKIKTVDGSGSGLDADTLDSHDTSFFLAASAYTAADVLTKIKTVDGSSSGLDADLLDGHDTSFFVAASAYTAADVLTKLLTVDGSGSTLDADKLDGHDSAFFAPAFPDTPSIVDSVYHAAGSGTGVVHILDYSVTADGVYRISPTFHISAAGNVTLEAIYTDPFGSSRTNYFEANQSTASSYVVLNTAAIGSTGAFGGNSLTIECKSGTTLSIRTQNSGGGGSDTFSVIIERLA